MRQLKYDNEFDNIVDDIEVWYDDEIPVEVKEFINKKLDSTMIYEQKADKYYCSKCFRELSKNYYCTNCHQRFSTSKYRYNDVISIDSIDIIQTVYFKFYVFDVSEGDVLLYEIENGIHLFRTTHLVKRNRMKIDKVFLVSKDSLLELLTNKSYSYQSLKKEYDRVLDLMKKEKFDLSFDEEQPLSKYFFNLGDSYLYTDNLLDLRNTIYKYTYIWDSTKYLKEHDFSLFDITALPLTNPCFEYLIKYKLYSLAYSNELLEFKKTFKDTFGVEKSHLDFMIKNDISYDELRILSCTDLEDIKLLQKLSFFCIPLEQIKSYNIDIISLLKYFKMKHYKHEYLYEYSDYIKMCYELKYNLKDKHIIFPKSLFEEHNKICSQYQMIKNPNIEKGIKKICNILQLNKYEDENYIIYPAPTLQSMLDESLKQNNCLKLYCEKYSNGETNIYFMRKKNNIKKSFVTIEVTGNKVIQARGKNNILPSEDTMKIIKKWENNLIPIQVK